MTNAVAPAWRVDAWIRTPGRRCHHRSDGTCAVSCGAAKGQRRLHRDRSSDGETHGRCCRRCLARCFPRGGCTAARMRVVTRNGVSVRPRVVLGRSGALGSLPPTLGLLKLEP